MKTDSQMILSRLTFALFPIYLTSVERGGAAGEKEEGGEGEGKERELGHDKLDRVQSLTLRLM